MQIIKQPRFVWLFAQSTFMIVWISICSTLYSILPGGHMGQISLLQTFNDYLSLLPLYSQTFQFKAGMRKKYENESV